MWRTIHPNSASSFFSICRCSKAFQWRVDIMLTEHIIIDYNLLKLCQTHYWKTIAIWIPNPIDTKKSILEINRTNHVGINCHTNPYIARNKRVSIYLLISTKDRSLLCKNFKDSSKLQSKTSYCFLDIKDGIEPNKCSSMIHRYHKLWDLPTNVIHYWWRSCMILLWHLCRVWLLPILVSVLYIHILSNEEY